MPIAFDTLKTPELKKIAGEARKTLFAVASELQRRLNGRVTLTEVDGNKDSVSFSVKGDIDSAAFPFNIQDGGDIITVNLGRKKAIAKLVAAGFKVREAATSPKAKIAKQSQPKAAK